jgi:hypothetical protein
MLTLQFLRIPRRSRPWHRVTQSYLNKLIEDNCGLQIGSKYLLLQLLDRSFLVGSAVW